MSADRAVDSSKTVGSEASSVLPDFDVDIPLDEDLSAYQEQSKHALHEEVELDFDLTVPGGKKSAYIESQVLSIDPTRSFSRQLDVNLRKLEFEGYITPDNVSTALSQNFRRLKRPILNNVRGKGATVLDNANLIMFTSSYPGEGKTFSAINMAMSIAMERDKRVLLIDADVSKPSHHKFFGAELGVGLTDLLMGEVDDVSDIIYKTNIPSLSLMFSGSETPHSTELLASEAMEAFVAELSQRYSDRIIIFDAAPLLLPTEASVLASHMGQIVLVVEAGETRRDDVRQSVNMLNNRIVLLLLNKVRDAGDQVGYGYYGNHED
ncbi:XrtA-associated tyrosine autokinase [Draconibacterium sp.]|nr:XrtA-associated tyrosine autokinase [Draconibacterium sp.]